MDSTSGSQPDRSHARGANTSRSCATRNAPGHWIGPAMRLWDSVTDEAVSAVMTASGEYCDRVTAL